MLSCGLPTWLLLLICVLCLYYAMYGNLSPLYYRHNVNNIMAHTLRRGNVLFLANLCITLSLLTSALGLIATPQCMGLLNYVTIQEWQFTSVVADWISFSSPVWLSEVEEFSGCQESRDLFLISVCILKHTSFEGHAALHCTIKVK